MVAYSVIRSKRRTMAIEITTDLRVVVRAPLRCDQRTIESFVCAHEDWVQRHLPVMRQRREQAMARQVTPQEEERLRRQAAEYIPARVAYYSAMMDLIPTGVRITGAQKRFGSCSGKNSLCFSWRLMQYPPQATDYVVVHELAHIAHHNHSPAFYALVEQVMPDWRARQALLRQ